MGYRAGETVIVTTHEKNHVGVILDRNIVNKQTVYNVLLENRTALVMVPTAPSKNTFINKTLTAKLCDTKMIETTIPYKTLLEEDLLPICNA